MAHFGLAQTNSTPAIGRSRSRKRSTPSAEVGAADRFVAVVVSAIEEKPEMFLEARGKLSVTVTDDKSLTLRFGDSKAPLTWEAEEDADLKLTTSSAVLRQILDGSVDAVAELSAGRLVLDGDIELLPPLFRLLERGKSMLSLRAGR